VKHVALINGWRDAPHCWRLHIRPWPRCREYGGGIWQIDWLGFVWFVEIGHG
jgi:hypothetical protein